MASVSLAFPRDSELLLKLMRQPNNDRTSQTLIASHLYLPEDEFDIPSTPIDRSGGSCELFLGRHVRFGQVALKRLHPNVNEAMIKAGALFLRLAKRSRLNCDPQREAETWSRLKHPHVLTFFGICKASYYVYLVSPFVEHGSIRGYLKRNPNANRPKLVCLANSNGTHGPADNERLVVRDGPSYRIPAQERCPPWRY